MLADQDLPELDPKPNRDDAPTAEPTSPPPSRAVVVIRERPRSRLVALVPPALILLVAFGILSFRVRSSDWRGWTFPEADAPKPAAEPETAANTTEPKSTATEPETIAVEAPTEPTAKAIPKVETAATEPEPVVEPKPVAKPKSDLVITVTPARHGGQNADAPRPEGEDGLPITLTAELYRPLLPGAERPAPVAAVPAVEVPEDDADPRRVWADLQREAQANADDRERLADLKPLLQQRDEARVEQQNAVREVEERRDAREQRNVFVKELQRALQANGAAAADAIRRLAHLPMDEPIPRDPVSIQRAHALAISINDRRAWIIQARAQGIEESEILSDLALAHLVNVVARSGPRSEDDALIRAGRELIAIPPNLTASMIPEPAQPGAGAAAVRSPRSSSRFGTSHRR